MSYYRTCPYCGAHLDSGERCDCQEEQNRNKTGTTKTANLKGDNDHDQN